MSDFVRASCCFRHVQWERKKGIPRKHEERSVAGREDPAILLRPADLTVTA